MLTTIPMRAMRATGLLSLFTWRCLPGARSRLTWIGLLGLMALLATLILLPISTGLMRTAEAGLALWLLGAGMAKAWAVTQGSRYRRWLTVGLTLAIAFVAWPKRFTPEDQADVAALQTRMGQRLRAYAGTPYLWGGEGVMGIDCSGLLRRSVIEALAIEGLRQLRPDWIRASAQHWWQDITAQGLGEGERRMTLAVPTQEIAPSINAANLSQLRPGDIANSWSGSHVLAYLGEGQWIHADPGGATVAIVSLPSSSPWFTSKVRLRRWTVATELP
jgi:hypothetical protein